MIERVQSYQVVEQVTCQAELLPLVLPRMSRGSLTDALFLRCRKNSVVVGRWISRGPSMRGLFIFVAIVASVCHLALLWAVSWNLMGLGAFLANHIVVCGACVGLAIAVRSRPETYAAFLQLALWGAIAGPFGAVIGAALGASEWSQEAATIDFTNWLDAQVGSKQMIRSQHLRNELLDHRLRIEGASRVIPLCDAFANGEQKEKLDVLAVIGRRFEPSFAHTLRLATRDCDPSVRVLASTVIAKLQTQETKRIAALKKAAALSNGAEPWLALGRARLEYSTSGLVASSQARDELNHALVCIEKALDLAPRSGPASPGNAEVHIDIARDRKAFHIMGGEPLGDSLQEQALQLRAQARLELGRVQLVSESLPMGVGDAARSVRAS
jgi:hypothetical protein